MARVLVMDDEKTVRFLAGEALAALGCEAVMAEEGERAVALYRQAMEEGRPIDLVILDLTVAGGMGGEEAVRRLLEIDPQARVVVSSGYVGEPAMLAPEAHGFRAVLPKPYSLQELAELLRRFIGPDISVGA